MQFGRHQILSQNISCMVTPLAGKWRAVDTVLHSRQSFFFLFLVFLRNKAACLYALSFILDGDDEEERGAFRYLRLGSTMEALFHDSRQLFAIPDSSGFSKVNFLMHILVPLVSYTTGVSCAGRRNRFFRLEISYKRGLGANRKIRHQPTTKCRAQFKQWTKN